MAIVRQLSARCRQLSACHAPCHLSASTGAARYNISANGARFGAHDAPSRPSHLASCALVTRCHSVLSSTLGVIVPPLQHPTTLQRQTTLSSNHRPTFM